MILAVANPVDFLSARRRAQNVVDFLSAGEIERRRRMAGISAAKLQRAANLDPRSYRAAIEGRASRAIYRRLAGALDALAAHRSAVPRDVVATLTSIAYRAFFEAMCQHLAIAPTAARAELGKAGERAADPAWRAASRARAFALYLTNTGTGVRQGDLARLTGLTPAAVSIAIGKVADELDAKSEAMLDAIERSVKGEG